jgi:hypothetical protein
LIIRKNENKNLFLKKFDTYIFPLNNYFSYFLMITVLPYKETIQFDLSRDLREYLNRSFSSNKSAELASSCDYVNSLRTKVVIAQQTPATARPILNEYLTTLRILETNLPGFQTSFSWRNSLDKKSKPIAEKSLSYEKTAILWNIISAFLHEVRNADFKTADGLKFRFQNLKVLLIIIIY